MKQSIIHSRRLRWAFALSLLLCCGSATAGNDYYCDFSVGGLYYQYVDGTDDEVAVSYNNYETGRYGGNYTNYSGYISVPSSVTYDGKTYKVTAVTAHCFQECGVTMVYLPNTVKSIGASAFLDCSQLTYVGLSQSLTVIGQSAFNGCTALQSVTLPTSLKEIGSSAFYGCKSITSITIPSGVTTIGASAFSGCSNLSSLSIPESVTTIGSSAFYGTPWLENQPDGVVYAGKVAYAYRGIMPEQTSIALKDGTLGIADYAFNSKTTLAAISIPSSVINIGASAFYGCSGLTSIAIPDGVTVIDYSVFSGCSGLKSVDFGSGLTTIGNDAFRGCSGLTTLTVPDHVTSIGSAAFSACSGLTSVVIGSGVATIDSYAFQYCRNLNTLTIGSGVQKINAYAFSECNQLSEISFPESLTSVGASAFNGTIWYDNQPDGMVYIARVAYKYKSTMPESTSIVIKDGTVSITPGAFYGQTGLQSVTIAESVEEMFGSTFYGCTNLTSVTALMKHPVAIDYDCFSNRTFATLYVPYECKAEYEAAEYWNSFKEIVELDPVATDVTSLTDAIYCEPATGLKGHDATLTIAMKNAQATSGYSFDLVLPEGVTVDSYELSDRHNGHSATMNRNETTDAYSFAVLSLQSKEIKGSDGAIWTLRLKVANDVAEGDYAVKIQNAKYSLTSGSTSVTMPETLSLLTVKDYVKGDANGDTTIDIADAVCIVNHVVGKATPAFNPDAADANGDGAVDIADAVRIVNLVVGKIGALSRGPNCHAHEPQ